MRHWPIDQKIGGGWNRAVFWRAMVTELWMQRYLDQPVGVAA